METLHKDVTDIKFAMRDLTTAITKLALIEERLSNNSNSLERAFKVLEGIENRVSNLEKENPAVKKLVRWIDFLVIGAVVILLGYVLRHIGVES